MGGACRARIAARVRTPRSACRKDSLLRGPREEALGSPGVEVSAPEVAMATEREAVESAVPSLVDRYFTRWYKAGKWGMMPVSPRPHGPDAVGTTTLAHRKPRAPPRFTPTPEGPVAFKREGVGICKGMED